MGQSGTSAGLQAHRSGSSKNRPHGPAGSRLRRVVGHPDSQRTRQEKQGSPVCSVADQLTYRRARLPDHGVRERPIAIAGCHATPRTQGIALLRIQRESMPGKLARSHCVCEQRWVRVGSHDCKAVKLLSTQIVCSTGESNSCPTRMQVARSSSTLSNSTNGCRAWQQRRGSEERPY
jgi:hypothetical protein